jgi:transposase-like protein
MIIAVMTNRLTQLALSLGFEEDLFQTYTTFLTEQYVRDARARERCSHSLTFSLSLSLSLSRARSRESVVTLQTFYSLVFIFYRNNRRQIVEKKGSHLKCTILRVRGEKCRVYLYALFCVCVCVCACLDVRVATTSDSFTTTTHRNRKKDIKEMRNSLSPIDRR